MARHHAVLRAAAPDKAIEPCTARCGRTGKAGSGKVEREDELKSGKPSRTGEGGTKKNQLSITVYVRGQDARSQAKLFRLSAAWHLATCKLPAPHTYRRRPAPLSLPPRCCLPGEVTASGAPPSRRQLREVQTPGAPVSGATVFHALGAPVGATEMGPRSGLKTAYATDLCVTSYVSAPNMMAAGNVAPPEGWPGPSTNELTAHASTRYPTAAVLRSHMCTKLCRGFSFPLAR